MHAINRRPAGTTTGEMTMLTLPRALCDALASLVGYPPVLHPRLTRRLEDGAMLGGR